MDLLTRYIHVLRAALHWRSREPGRKLPLEELEDSATMSFSSIQKQVCVTIVLAGGLVEIHQGSVIAAEVLGRYPGMCVARPDVFRQPAESVVHPAEELKPGHKFYLVPATTVKKLKRMNSGPAAATSGDSGDDESDKPVCSARDFYVSRERWRDCILSRRKKGAKALGFTPPIRKRRVVRRGGWKPSLDSVEELVSP